MLHCVQEIYVYKMNLFKISRVYTLTNDKHFQTISEVASTMESSPLSEDLSFYISKLKDSLSKEQILSGDGRSAPFTSELRKNYRSLNLLSTVVKKTIMVAQIKKNLQMVQWQVWYSHLKMSILSLLIQLQAMKTIWMSLTAPSADVV